MDEQTPPSGPLPSAPAAKPKRPIKSKLFGSKKRGLVTLVIAILVVLGSISIYMVTKGGGKGPNHSSSAQNQSAFQNLPDCGTGKQLLSNSPVALADLTTIIPMGNIAPPGHIGPTPHMYYNYVNAHTASGDLVPAKTNLYSPADITVTSIAMFDNASAQKPFNSYRIDFSICRQVTGYFIHTVRLEGKLASAMKPPYDHVQTSHIDGVHDEHVYTKLVNIKLKAGELFGTGGGGPGLPAGLDFGMQDKRMPVPVEANPARWTYDSHYVCSLDYYPPALSAQLYQHIGDYDFRYLNPGNPKCGTVYQDIPGTAQGVWFTPDQPKNAIGDAAHEASLIHSNLNHAKGVFALGGIVSKLGLESDQPLPFVPQAAGFNVDFSQVKADGKVYCYQIPNQSNYSMPANVILLQLRDANSLRLGSLSGGTCGSGPWQMGASYIDYIR